MSAYKDKKTGKWFVFFYYRDWQGKNKGKTKREFQTKREALEWEREFKQKQEINLDMSFENFVEIYSKDMRAKLKLNTWLTKENIIQTKLIPAFGSKKMNEIRPADVIAWQNKMLAYKDEKGVVTINKSYQRIQGEDVITEPKTAKSNRTIQMPDFLVEEIKDYLKLLYGCKSTDRIFPITKSYLHHEMDRGAKEAGVKRIKIHEIGQPKVKHKTKILLSFLQKIFYFPFNLYAVFFKNINFINKKTY